MANFVIHKGTDLCFDMAKGHHIACALMYQSNTAPSSYRTCLSEYMFVFELRKPFGCTAALYATDIRSVANLPFLCVQGWLAFTDGTWFEASGTTTSHLETGSSRLTRRSWFWTLVARSEVSEE